MLHSLLDPACWLEYQAYKRSSGHLSRQDDADLEAFIQNRKYLPVVEALLSGGRFAPPVKREISKLSSPKKRVVYTYKDGENRVLKLLTFLLQRKYDRLFCPNLYSFRKGRSVRDAVKTLTGHPGVDAMWVYKVDISNYFITMFCGWVLGLPALACRPGWEAVLPAAVALAACAVAFVFFSEEPPAKPLFREENRK